MKYFSVILISIAFFQLNAQQGISLNDDGTDPDASAILDLQSTGKGFLIPRMGMYDRNAILNPAIGLLIYQTDDSMGFYYYDGYWRLLGQSHGYIFACNLLATTSVTNVSINGGSDGTVTVTQTGGTAPFIYQWDGVASGQTTSTATGLPAGTYCVTLTDANACTFTDCGITITEPGIPPAIGGFGPAGGYIFYLASTPTDLNGDGTLDIGLECAPYDQVSALWGCHPSFITGADATGVGTGAQNTLDILASCSTPGIAAEICDTLTLNGYTDWFLPSRDELDLMYLNLERYGIGNFYYIFGHNTYWSSSEFNHNSASAEIFTGGYGIEDEKYNINRIRAARAF